MKKRAEDAVSGARLPLRVKMGFGVGDLGGNLFFTVMGFYTSIFLTDAMGISPLYAGVAFWLSKLWDAVVDPFIGYISDRTRSRWGRRRPYLLFGALPLLLAMWLFFSSPNFAGNDLMGCLWAGLVLCLLNTAYSVVNINYSSLTPELTKDYKERTVLNGYRFGFAVIGTLLGAVAVPLITQLAGGNARVGYSVSGLVFGIIMAGTILISFFSVREPAQGAVPGPKEKFLSIYFTVFKNRVYLRLAAVYMLHLIGLTLVQSNLSYYFKYFYKADFALAMLILLVVALICVPISVLVAKRIGKKRTYQIALLILAVSCMAIFFFGHILGMNFTLALMLFAGVGLGFAYAPPFAMLPDVVEADAVRTNSRKEGAYYGMWTFCSQVGVAIAAGIALFCLGFAGYVTPEFAEQVVVQPPAAMFMIRLLLGPIPAVIFVSAIFLLQGYPIDEKAYNAIMAESELSASAEGTSLQ